MWDSSSTERSTFSEETVTRYFKNPSTSSPENTACLPGETGDEYTSYAGGRHGEQAQGHCKSGGAAVRRRLQIKHKTHTVLIQNKLEQTKAEMRTLWEQHLRQRPERKAYHPFVWNSLSPYRDTTEIDYLLAMPSEH